MKNFYSILEEQKEKIISEARTKKPKKVKDLASSAYDGVSVDAGNIDDLENGANGEDDDMVNSNQGFTSGGSDGSITREKSSKNSKNIAKELTVDKMKNFLTALKQGEKPLNFDENKFKEIAETGTPTKSKIAKEILNVYNERPSTKSAEKKEVSTKNADKGLYVASKEVLAKNSQSPNTTTTDLVPIKNANTLAKTISKDKDFFNAQQFVNNFDNYMSKKMDGKSFLKQVFPKLKEEQIAGKDYPAVVSNVFKAIAKEADKNAGSKPVTELRKLLGEKRFEAMMKFSRTEKPKNLGALKKIYGHLEDGRNLKGDGVAPVQQDNQKEEKVQQQPNANIKKIKDNSGVQQEKPEAQQEKQGSEMQNSAKTAYDFWASGNKINQKNIQQMVSDWKQNKISTDEILDTFEDDAFSDFMNKAKKTIKNKEILSDLEKIASGEGPSAEEQKVEQPAAKSEEPAVQPKEEKNTSSPASEQTKETEKDQEEEDETSSEEKGKEEKLSSKEEVNKDRATEYHDEISKKINDFTIKINDLVNRAPAVGTIKMNALKVSKDFKSSSSKIKSDLEKATKLLTDFPTENSIRRANALIAKADREFGTLNTVYGNQIETLEKRVGRKEAAKEEAGALKAEKKEANKEDVLSRRQGDIEKEQETIKALKAKLNDTGLPEEEKGKVREELDVATQRLNRLQKVGAVDVAARKVEKAVKGSALYRPAARIADATAKAAKNIASSSVVSRAKEALNKVAEQRKAVNAVNSKLNNTTQQTQETAQASQEKQEAPQNKQQSQEAPKVSKVKPEDETVKQAEVETVPEVEAKKRARLLAQKVGTRFGIS